MVEPKNPTEKDEQRGSDYLPNFMVCFHHIYHDYPTFHDHDWWEFFIVTQGEYRNALNGKDYYMKEGDAMLIRPKDRHAIFDAQTPSGHINVILSISYFKEFCDSYCPTLYDSLLNKESLPVVLSEREIDRINEYCLALQGGGASVNDVRMVDSILTAAILDSVLSQNLLFQGNRPKWFRELLKDINSSSNKHWKVKDVVDHCNYSHTHLGRLFREYVGCSILQYMSKIKIYHACDALLHSNVSVSSISEKLGYSSVTNFNAAFKKSMGMSPMQYRKYKKLK